LRFGKKEIYVCLCKLFESALFFYTIISRSNGSVAWSDVYKYEKRREGEKKRVYVFSNYEHIENGDRFAVDVYL